MSTKLAVIKAGGKQYIVKEGDVFKIEMLPIKVGENVSFHMLLKADGDAVEIGMPTLKGQVKAEVMSHGRHPKISVVHYKPKVRYTKRSGHRQPFTQVKIKAIE